MCIAASAIINLASTALDLIGNEQERNDQDRKNQSAKQYNEWMADTLEKKADEVLATSELQRKMITAGASRASQAEMVKSRGVLASQRAAAAGSGLGGGSVTVENLAIDEANKSVLDDVYIRFKSEQAKWINKRQAASDALDLRKQAISARMSADVYQGNSDAINASAGWDTASTLLNSAGQLADRWYRNKGE